MAKLSVVLLLVALAAASSSKGSAQSVDDKEWCFRVSASVAPQFKQPLLECPAVPFLLFVPYLWSPVTVSVKCTTPWFSVYTGKEPSELVKQLDDKASASCGWGDLFDGTTCNLQLSPFQKTLVGISAGPITKCNITSHAQTNLLMIASGIAGPLLFYMAGLLSSSFVFRLSCGSTTFTMFSLLFLAWFLLRMLPHKRSMAAAAATFGTGTMAVVRYITGQWLPSLRQLINNRLFAAYVVLSAIIGAAATYLYDDMRNPRLNTLFKVGLRLIALALVYYSTWTSWPLSATVIGILVTSVMSKDIVKGAQETQVRVQKLAKAIATPFTARKQRRAHFAATPASAARVPLDATPRTLFSTDVSEMVHKAMGRDEYQMAPVVPEGTPKHLKSPPPNPWDVQPKRQVQTFEEKMASVAAKGSRITRASAQQVRRDAAGPGTAATPGAALSGTTGTRADDTTADSTGTSAQGTPGVAFMVRKGYILNVATGRPIKIGGDTYNKLLSEGYTVNTTAGVIVAPTGLPSASAAPGSTGRGRSVLQ